MREALRDRRLQRGAERRAAGHDQLQRRQVAVDRRAGQGGHEPADHALEAVLRAWCDYVPEILPVARALEAALVTGDEGGSAWRDRMGELHAVFASFVRRVELAPGWTERTATDWIWARVQPSAYAHLVGERGWTHADYTERTVASLLAELTRSSPAPRRPA